MESFVKKIFNGKIDEAVHRQFVRFGKGVYSGRAVLSLQKATKVKLKGSFEYANDFVLFASEFNARFSGIILSREKLDLENEKKKAGIYQYEVSGLDSNKIKEIENKVYCLLLDGEGEGLILKIKKKLPKPGKSGEGKVNDKFCIIEGDLKYFQKIKDAFLWDAPEFRKAKVSHDYVITDLAIPENDKDFEKIRILTKRKGKIIRKLEIDGRQEVKEREFEV